MLRNRAPATAGPIVVGAGAAPVVVRKRTSPIQFLREVRAEARKITWTSWKETWITSVMVGILVLITAFFFFAVDWILGLGMASVLKLVNGG